MQEQEIRASAGISSLEDVDVDTLYAQLREELGRGPGGAADEATRFAASRSLAERFWPVSAERDAGGGPKGFVKRVLRKLMRWYVEPLAADQRRFNGAVLRLTDALSERDEAGQAALEHDFNAGLDEQRAATAAEAQHGV